jgi:rhomboid family GlyGly-CTERM serine protease
MTTTTQLRTAPLRRLPRGLNPSTAPKSTGVSLPLVTLALGLATLVASLPGLGPALQYDRVLAPSNLYRILTCHCAHYSVSHLIWSVGAFVVLGSICEMQSRTQLVACFIISSVMIPLGLHQFAPSLRSYRGLSGIDSALFFLASVPLIVQQWRDRRPTRMLFILLPMLFLAKLLYEQVTGAAIFVNSSRAFVPVPLAHLMGAAVGAACALLPVRLRIGRRRVIIR